MKRMKGMPQCTVMLPLPVERAGGEVFITFISFIIFISFILFIPFSAFAEDGSRLWLRYEPLPDSIASQYKQRIHFKGEAKSSTRKLAMSIFEEGFTAMTGSKLFFPKILNDGGSLVFKQDDTIKGYKIETIVAKRGMVTQITGQDDTHIIYGVYHLLRLMQTHQPIDKLDIHEIPAYERRILNHWDNIDGTIERGYAGYSLWDWDGLPATISPRYEEYARANAGIGINGTVLNNVNANPRFITKEYLEKAAAIADVLRPYGIRVYLSINFSSPAELGGLPTSDPIDNRVREWWKKKAGEIYSIIPDFGGFLVKANSEGLPGPQDFGRTHADGANMLAEVLEPYGGIVMWRAFVYDAQSPDRAKQAYEEFVPLDGQFRSNVIIQVKNGPVDFQPREPFNPLFGAMQKTNLMIEFQITQEYLGFSNHLAYLAPMYQECLWANTYANDNPEATVMNVTNGTVFPQSVTAIAGVANIGKDTNWTGHHFAQANWYCFGRQAWNPALTSEDIADEWLRMTFGNDSLFLNPIKEMMLESREAVVNYMMPLGLAHLFAWEHHYGPEPWLDISGARPDWMPSYYHKADEEGLGFNRTTSGSNAVSQYFSPLKEIFNDIHTCPENLLLWFHHVPWDYPMQSGRTMWDELCRKYQEGVDSTRRFRKIWDSAAPFVDKERFEAVRDKLEIQERDAIWWKDACLLYFQTFSNRPIPEGVEPAVHKLDDLKKIKLDLKHHN